MNCGDDSVLWKAIDWKGQFNPESSDDVNQPSELQFRDHLENLLNPGNEGSKLIYRIIMLQYQY